MPTVVQRPLDRYGAVKPVHLGIPKQISSSISRWVQLLASAHGGLWPLGCCWAGNPSGAGCALAVTIALDQYLDLIGPEWTASFFV